jgi:anaerobic selenocysteine-containing dehydrogenase
MDCPDSCALEVTVDDGKIIKIGGAKNHPDTNGFICDKISRFGQRVYHADRIHNPLRRTGPKGAGEFKQITWSEAIEEIVSRFRAIIKQYGAEAILPYHYGGSNGLLGDDGIDSYFFARLGASRIAKTLCAAPTTAVATEMYGKMPGVAYKDFIHAQFVVIWGANPKSSHIHLIPYLRKAKRNGAFIAVIDPRRNFSSEEIDLHLPIKPGTDLVLALGLINYYARKKQIDEEFIQANCDGLDPLLSRAKEWTLKKTAAETGLKSIDIQLLADGYANTAPAVIRCGWGVERNRNGGQAVAAILALPALLNKFGERGGGYTLSNGAAVTVDKHRLFGPVNWQSRQLNMTQLGRLLNDELNPPIKSLFIYNCNPVATVPDQNSVIKGLQREDLFTVVSEQVKTDSVRYADLVLPAVTFMEQYELKRGYGSYMIGGVKPVIDPVGEAKPNEYLFCELGKAMGWDDLPFTWSTDLYIKSVHKALKTPHDLPQIEHFLDGQTAEISFDRSTPIQFKSVYPRTQTGKVNLTPATLGSDPYSYIKNIDSFPYSMISPASSKMISSSLGEFNFPKLKVIMISEDAARDSLIQGDLVRVFNDLGEVRCHLDTSTSIRKGVVMLPKGAWSFSSKNGQTSTALCPDHVNVVAGGACYNDARVAIEKVPNLNFN